MARFYGKIGFLKTDAEMAERPSRYKPEIEERYYAGELLKNYAKTQNADKTVDDFTINNDISIVADPYALNHFSSMKYIEFMSTLWEVQSVTVEYPRLRISFGGLYNGPTPET